MDWQEILNRASDLWLSARKEWRDIKLEVGGLLSEYLTERLSVADSVPEYQRSDLRCSRKFATADAAKNLKITLPVINELIRTFWVVKLLADNDNVGELSFTSLRSFRVAIERPQGKVSRNKKDGFRPSEKEVWRVREPAEEFRTFF